MIDWIKETTAYGLPWWTLLLPSAVAGVALFTILSRILGVRSAIHALFLYGAAVVVALAHRRGQQAGWEDRIEKERRDAEAMRKRINRALDDDTDGLRDNDGYRRD